MVTVNRMFTILTVVLMVSILLAPLQSGSSTDGGDDARPQYFSLSTSEHVDGSLIYLAEHPDEMDELGASPAPDGFIRVLMRLDSLDRGDRDYIEDLGGTITDIWHRFDSLAATVPLDSLDDLVNIPGLDWLEPSVILYPMLASSVPAIGGDVVHDDYGFKGENMTIAVLDTGINGDHEYLDDLDDNDTTNDTKVIGFYDARSGSRGETDPYDTGNHGSHCAGIAAGTGGTDAVDVGMAPQAYLVGVIVLDGGGGTADDIIHGINWTIDNKDRFGIDVMSMSLGGAITIPGATNDGNSVVSRAVDRAVDAGIVSTVAVGNGNAQVAAHAGSVTFPADSRRAITVGWVNDNGNRAISSSRGPTGDGRIKPDVMAPGSGIDSARGTSGDTGSSSQSGSSMSCPHVAGLAALMLQANPDLAPDDNVDHIKQILHETSRHEWGDSPDPFEPYSPNNQYGWGTVDSVGAVQRALDLNTGVVDGPSTLQLGTHGTFEYTLNYTKTLYTDQGQNGDSHGPPTGTTAPDVVYLQVLIPSDWPEPIDITGDAKEASGLTATVEPTNITANDTDGRWVIGTWINYTGDGDTGDYWKSFPTLTFNLTAPDQVDSSLVRTNYSINGMPGNIANMTLTSSGDLPDLTITSLGVDDERPQEDDIVEIAVRVKNIGDGAALEADLSVYDGDPEDNATVLGSIILEDIGSGESTDVYFDWNTSGQIGEHTLHARLSSVSPKDADNDNNDADPLDIEVVEKGAGGGATPPEITLDAPSDGSDIYGTVQIEGTASDVDEEDDIETVEVAIMSSGSSPGSGDWMNAEDRSETSDPYSDWGFEWETTHGEDGDFTVHARAKSTDGKWTDTLTVDVTVENDNTVPSVTIIEPETGSEHNDTVLIRGQATDDDDEIDSIEVAIDDDTFSSGTLSVDVAKVSSDTWNWSAEWDTDGYSAGDHTIHVRATDERDAKGHAEVTVTVINEAPEISFTVLTDEDEEIDLAEQTEYLIEWVASDPDDDAEISLYRDSNSVYNDGNSEDEVLITAGLSEDDDMDHLWDVSSVPGGEYYLYAVIDDDANDPVVVHTDHTLTVIEDESNERPDVEISEPGSGEVVLGTVTISGLASDTDGEVDTVRIRIGDGPWQDCADDSTGDPWSEWSFVWDTTSEDDGAVSIKVRATDDAAGSTDDSISVTVDNSGDSRPSVTVLPPGDGPFADNITIEGTASDPDGSVDQIEISVGDNSFADPFIAVGTDSWTINLDISRWDLGTYTIYVRAVDDEELTSVTDSVMVDVDNRVPVAVVDLVDPQTVYLSGTVTLTGHGENGDIVNYRWTSDEFGVLGEDDTLVVGAGSLSIGVNTIRFQVQGANGLWSETESVTVTVRSESEGSSESSNDFQSFVLPGMFIFIIIVIVLALALGGGGESPSEVEPYTPEVVAGPPVVCPTCSNAAEFYPQYGMHYCHTCQQYLQ